MKETIMNQEKLAKLQAQVRIGGKVSFRVFFFFVVSLACHLVGRGHFIELGNLGEGKARVKLDTQ